MRVLPILIAGLLLSEAVIADSPVGNWPTGNWPIGNWVVPGADAVLTIEHENDQLTIRILSTLDPEALDEHTNRPLSGTVIGTDFDSDEHAWTSGKLYDPVSGKTYRARLRVLDDHHLEVRGYIGTPLLGRSEVWTRLSHFRRQMNTMLARAAEVQS